jgi:hypothetical protein
MMVNYKKGQKVNPEDWPESLRRIGFDGEVIYEPWTAHDVKVPEEYQIKLKGEIPAPANYLKPDQEPTDPVIATSPYSFAQFKGISATGKGTRVAMLLDYLLANYQWKLLFEDDIPNFHEAEKPEDKFVGNPNVPRSRQYVGILVPALNLLILGAKIVKSNKSRLLSLTGADSITSGLSHCTLFEMLHRYAKKYNVLFEGYAGLEVATFDLENQLKDNGQDRYILEAFRHASKDVMLERFKDRSYQVAKGDSAFKNNERHSTIPFKRISEQAKKYADQMKFVHLNMTDSTEEPIFAIIRYLKAIGVDPTAFVEHTKHSSFKAKRSYTDPAKNYQDYWLLFKFLEQEIQAGVKNG